MATAYDIRKRIIASCVFSWLDAHTSFKTRMTPTLAELLAFTSNTLFSRRIPRLTSTLAVSYETVTTALCPSQSAFSKHLLHWLSFALQRNLFSGT